MALIDSIISVIPDAYRRDVIVLGIGVAIGTGWWHFESRIDTAYAAAADTKSAQQQILDLKQQQALTEAQTATIQSNVQATKQELDELMVRLVGTTPLPTAPAVPAHPKK